MRFLLGSLLLLSFSSAHAAQITKTTYSFPGRVEIHVQPELSELDVLFVVDDSASMQDHQANLSKNIPELAKAVLKEGVHVHAGVTTTSDDHSIVANNGRFNGPMADSKSPDFLKNLAKSLEVGTRGSPEEKPLDMAVAAMTEAIASTDHPDFYRPRAQLAVIFLTDADDQSRQNTPESFASFFQSLKSRPNQVTVASIQTLTNRPSCFTGEDFGTKLTSAVNLMGGKAHDICAPDYGTHLGEIGSDIVRKVTREIPLTAAPDVASIVVTFGNTVLAKGDLHHGWIYDSVSNLVVLGDMIDWASLPGDELVVSFIPKDWK